MKEIERKLQDCKNRVFPYADLNMKNGDEVTVEAPCTTGYEQWGNKDYTVLTDDNRILHFKNLEKVVNWIFENYC